MFCFLILVCSLPSLFLPTSSLNMEIEIHLVSGTTNNGKAMRFRNYSMLTFRCVIVSTIASFGPRCADSKEDRLCEENNSKDA